MTPECSWSWAKPTPPTQIWPTFKLRPSQHNTQIHSLLKQTSQRNFFGFCFLSHIQGAQDLLLVGLRGTEVPGIKPSSAVCMASAVFAILLLWPLRGFCLLERKNDFLEQVSVTVLERKRCFRRVFYVGTYEPSKNSGVPNQHLKLLCLLLKAAFLSTQRFKETFLRHFVGVDFKSQTDLLPSNTVFRRD